MKRYSNIKVLIADEIDKSGILLLRDSGIDILEFPGISGNNLIKKLNIYKNIKIVLIIRSIRKLNRKDLNNIKNIGNVVLICTASSGFDNIDIDSAKKLKLKVINVPVGNYISAAEHTLALILSIVKNIPVTDLIMKSGKYDFSNPANYELKGKTIGVIGVGRVGSYVAKLCRALGMKILGNDIKKSLRYKYPWINFVSLNTLLKKSDIVTVHTPLDKSTENLLNEPKLLTMKDGAVLINCARGE